MTERTSSTATAIVPCNDIDAAERWWNRLGFTRPADQNHADYRMLSDGDGAEVHLQRALAGWLVPGRNPFGIYLYTHASMNWPPSRAKPLSSRAGHRSTSHGACMNSPSTVRTVC